MNRSGRPRHIWVGGGPRPIRPRVFLLGTVRGLQRGKRGGKTGVRRGSCSGPRPRDLGRYSRSERASAPLPSPVATDVRRCPRPRAGLPTPRHAGPPLLSYAAGSCSRPRPRDLGRYSRSGGPPPLSPSPVATDVRRWGPPQGGPPHSSARRAAIAQLRRRVMLTPTTS